MHVYICVHVSVYVCTCVCLCHSKCHFMCHSRLWDFDRDENYLLELSSVGQIPETAHVTFIDYNKLKGERERVTV